MQKIIDISTPNDGLGDVLRTGFDKTNQNFTELYNGKVDKIPGKGLSENDFTDADKTKLDGIEAGAQVNVNADFLETDPNSPGYILNVPPSLYSAFGYFHYADLDTQTTPLNFVASTPLQLINDTLGFFTNENHAPYGISTVWDKPNDSLDFSQLSIGDAVLFRADLSISTTSVNQNLQLYIKFGIGTPSEYDLLIDSWNEKSVVSFKHFIKDVSFSIDNPDWRDAPAKIFLLSDDDGSVKVNGWYIPIIRKSVNIVNFTGGDDFKKKIENTRYKSTLSGENVIIPFQAAGQSHYSVTNATLVSVAGFTTAGLTTPMYEGQDVIFENQTGHEITLKNSFGVETSFVIGADLIVPNKGKIWFRFRNNELELIDKNWFDINEVATAQNLGEFINSLDSKTNVKDTDEFVLSDSDDGLKSKKTRFLDIKNKLKGYFDTLYLSLSIFNDFATDVFSSLDNKLDKSTTPSSVYGTSTAGVQTMIPLSDFGTVKGTGTTNYVSKFTGSGTLGNSQIFDNGTNVGIGTNTPSTSLDVLGALTLRKTSENEQTILTINRFNSVPMFKLHISGVNEDQLFLRNDNNQNIITFQRSGGIIVQGSLYSNTELGIGRSIGDYLSKFLSTDAYGSFYELQTDIEGVGWGSLLQWNRNRTYFNILSNNVGIGTTSPQARLDVRAQGALATDIAFRVRNSTDTANLLSVNGQGTLSLGMQATAPTGIEGAIYYNSTDKKHYGFNGTTWNALY